MSEDEGSEFRSESYQRRRRLMDRTLLPFDLLEVAGLAILLAGGVIVFMNF